VRDFYIRSRGFSLFLFLLASDNAAQLTRELFYRNSIANQDKEIILDFSRELKQLETDKEKLEKNKTWLSQTKQTLGGQATFLRKEVEKVEGYLGEISGKMGKEITMIMRDEGKSAAQIIKEGGLIHITDEDQITEVVKKVIAANHEAVSDYRKGKEPALKYLIGQIMKETKGQANPEIVAKILKEQL